MLDRMVLASELATTGHDGEQAMQIPHALQSDDPTRAKNVLQAYFGDPYLHDGFTGASFDSWDSLGTRDADAGDTQRAGEAGRRRTRHAVDRAIGALDARGDHGVVRRARTADPYAVAHLQASRGSQRFVRDAHALAEHFEILAHARDGTDRRVEHRNQGRWWYPCP